MHVTGGQLLDISAGRDAEAPIRWLLAQRQERHNGIAWGTLNLSGAYQRDFDVALPHVGQIVDTFHLIRMGNKSTDEVRSQVQDDTLGHCGRNRVLSRVRRQLILAHERQTNTLTLNYAACPTCPWPWDEPVRS